MQFKITVLGFTPYNPKNEIDEAKEYTLYVREPEDCIEFFRELCEKDYGYSEWTPCILASYKEIEDICVEVEDE